MRLISRSRSKSNCAARSAHCWQSCSRFLGRCAMRTIGHDLLIEDIPTNDGSSARAATGASIHQRPQCYLELTLINIGKLNGCFSEFITAGLDPLLPHAVSRLTGAKTD